MFAFDSLRGVPGLRHALTTRRRGPQTAAGAARALGLDHVATLRQVHGARVVEPTAATDEPPAADALVLTTPGLAGAIFGADCPLLLLVAPAERVLALVHSGWRGTAAGVAPTAVRHLERVHGVRPEALRVVVGPSMCGAHYEVGDEVVDAMQRAVPSTEGLVAPTRPGHALLDLALAIEWQLRSVGVPHAAIERHPACTWEAKDTFHSYRRDGEDAGRHVLVAGWVRG